VGPLEAADDLCVLQLHGCIAWPRKHEGESIICNQDLFGKACGERIDKLCFNPAGKTTPPIIFPWEIMDDSGQILPEQNFCLKETMGMTGRRQGGYSGQHDMRQLFVSIWKRAQKEINRATKISFVGLSMHEFLNPAFKFLFSQKTDDAQIVVANKELSNSKNIEEARTHPMSPAFKVRKLLQTVWPRTPVHTFENTAGETGIRETFADFIKHEIN
jgi:hypothetical protein